MTTAWRPFVRVIQDGELVDASVSNRPIIDLTSQAQYLKERLSALDTASGKVTITAAQLGASVNAGDFVYFDEATGSFEKAIAEVEPSGNGQFVASRKSFVVGMVVSKSSSTLGDIVQTGKIDLNALGINPTGMLEDSSSVFSNDRYYLSRKIPGKMTRAISSPSIQLGFFTATTSFIQPLQKDLFESHYQFFELSQLPLW